MKNKIDWGTRILQIFTILFDLFFTWFNTSLAMEYYHDGKFDLAAIFVLGTILWSLCLVRDGEDMRKANIENDKSTKEEKK